ncbi:MAG: MerR family transcriptional regulator [Rhodobacteraceae bacterium]|nr:MerR family transcriptional regulator [Paracoccaceae bacterium]
MAKAPDAFRTISEVSEWLDTPTYVLRFWESRFPQIKPVKRAGGRRYYRPDDMLLLGGIKRLLHFEGNTIKGVQHIIKSKGVKHVAKQSPGLSEKVVSPDTVDRGDPKAGLDSMAVLKKDKPKARDRKKPATLKLTEDDKSAGAEVLSVKPVKKAKKERPTEDAPIVTVQPKSPQQTETPAAEANQLPPTQESADEPERIKTITFDATMMSGPFAIRPAKTYSAEDFQEIETLYYSLKMVRNNMRRVSKSD